MRVNKILKQFTKMVKQLDDEAAYQNKMASVYNEEATVALMRKDAAKTEANRATNIKSKIENLLK